MIRSVGVVVPAADEQERLSDCIAAISSAAAELHRVRGRTTSIRVIVVLDSCTDASAALASAAGVDALSVELRCVGAARRAGCARHLRITDDPSGVWLANTDADSRVPQNWLAGMLALADAGADVVLGTVVPDRGLEAGAAAAWHREHRLVDDHPYIHGANLGIRASTYLALGGWPPIRTGEDIALARLAQSRVGTNVVASAAIPVITSSRRDGRAPAGFSSYLRGLAADAVVPTAASA